MRPIRSTITGVALLSVLMLAIGCAKTTGKADTRAADEKAIRDLVDRTVAAAGQKDMAAYSKYYAPKATLALPGLAITELTPPLKNAFPAGYSIKMVTVKTEVSDAADLGYALGTYEQTAPDKSGALVNTVGKWMSVFKKQPDGSWGAIADTFNVDPPVQP